MDNNLLLHRAADNAATYTGLFIWAAPYVELANVYVTLTVSVLTGVWIIYRLVKDVWPKNKSD